MRRVGLFAHAIWFTLVTDDVVIVRDGRWRAEGLFDRLDEGQTRMIMPREHHVCHIRGGDQYASGDERTNPQQDTDDVITAVEKARLKRMGGRRIRRCMSIVL